MSRVSPLLRKEIRLLLPSFGVAMVLAIFPVWIIAPEEGNLSFTTPFSMTQLAFGVGVVMIAVSSFGLEFGSGVFSILLAQPASRRRIWTVKVGLASIALLMAAAAVTISNHTYFTGFRYYPASSLIWSWMARLSAILMYVFSPQWIWSADFAIGFMIAITALASCLWTTLLFRQIGAAIFFTILTPLAIVVAAGFVSQHTGIALSPTILLVLYAAAAILWARGDFLRAEDTPRLSQAVSMPSVRRFSYAPTGVSRPRVRMPLRALLARELLLHQITLFMAGSLLLFHLVALVLRRFSGPSLPIAAQLIFAIAPVLWLFFPWLVGSVAVAEERRQGTLESQLCLPVTRRLQFAVKLGTVVALALLVGGVAPWGLEALGMVFHSQSPLLTVGGDVATAEQVRVAFPDWFYFALAQNFSLVFFAWAALAVASALLAFFCSSLARHSLHALAAAVIAASVLAALLGWALDTPYRSLHPFVDHAPSWGMVFYWKGPWILIGIPLLFGASVGLSFINYGSLVANRRLWIRNVAILAVALLFAGFAAPFVYPRPWERLMTLVPPPGPERFRGAGQAKLCGSRGNIFALLPGGRLWAFSGESTEGAWPPTGWQFLPGAEWTDIYCNGEIVSAFRSDGTLWRILDSFQIERVGPDSRWKAVLASPERRLFMVKTDGSLWAWGWSWVWPSQEAVSFSNYLKTGERGLLPTQFANRDDHIEPWRVGMEADFPRVVDLIESKVHAGWSTPKFSNGLARMADGTIAVAAISPFAALSTPIRRSDWIAATDAFEWPFTALAADGAICTWVNFSGGIFAPTRRPLWCANVLADSADKGTTEKEAAR